MSIAAIVVTFNRLQLLRECIAALRAQTQAPDEIIVVDNGSTDDTPAWLAGQTGLTVIRQGNGGSSGGQFTGIKTAYLKNHDWFWCMDDDTIPNSDCLEMLITKAAFQDESTGFLASAVLWTDGTPHRMNTPGTSNQHDWIHTVLKDHCIRVSTASFVSVMVSRPAVQRVGLPMRDFFIWSDDVEFTGRITRNFKGYFVLDSIAVHKTPKNIGPVVERVLPASRTKYLFGLRNRVIVLRREENMALLKWAEIARVMGSAFKQALMGRAPFAGVWWVIRGIFYRSRIEFPA